MLSTNLKELLTKAKNAHNDLAATAEWVTFTQSAETQLKGAAKKGFAHFNFEHKVNADKAIAMFTEIGFEPNLRKLQSSEYQVTVSW